ncbi:MAG: TonB-dependent receptor, partial [Ferruginibacter sp.]|nr:TonB-dependent receptor [Ferruginibacter sp.]
MTKRIILFALAYLLIINYTNAQLKAQNTDSMKFLPDITIVGKNSKSDYQQMPEIVGTNIYAGKKSTLIVLDNVQGNITTNNMRQVLAKVPGIHIWESDPSGTQIGIAARGLSPNRSWEFNIRQNGYDIAADPFGYPEAYYNPQLQAVQRLEVVRGHGSLQYGPQFGGMVNYILKNGSDINTPFQFETQQTLGSNSLFNSYNAIGGKKGKFNYYAFFDYKNGDGYRDNSHFFAKSGFATVTYKASKKLMLTAELMQSHTRAQQPGGLADKDLYNNPKQSLRSRNWLDIAWTTPALTIVYNVNDKTIWNTKFFGTIGNRSSVGFLQAITIKDTVNASTLQYNNRAVNIDRYRNYGMESRVLTSYNIGKMKNTLSGGVRLNTGNTLRQTEGKGSTRQEYDVSIVGQYPKDIVFNSQNAAFFAENIFRIGKKLLLIPGVRYEWVKGNASGRNGFTNTGNEILLQNIERSRKFLLAGFGAEYHITNGTEMYSNISQAYRPIQFANLQAPPTATDVVDQNLKDAKGYNVDFGYRGKLKNFLQFDVSTFYLQYNNRIGTVTPAGSNTRLITNVGASNSKGFEGFVEFSPTKVFAQNYLVDVSLFGSYGYTDAKYSSNFKDVNTKGKRVENAPQNIFRGGITFSYKELNFTTQLSSVGKAYSDANNTEKVTANAQNGLIPSYT